MEASSGNIGRGILKKGAAEARLEPFLSPWGAWAYGVGSAIGWGSLVVTTSQYLLQGGPVGSVAGLVVGALLMMVIVGGYRL